MKKNLREVIAYLKKNATGKPVVRTKKTVKGRKGFLSAPCIIAGFSKEGGIVLSSGEILPEDYTDRNWVSVAKVKKGRHNPLNQWRGRRIRRIRATSSCSLSFLNYVMFDEPPTLVAASKHHIILLVYGREMILGEEFAAPEGWELAD